MTVDTARARSRAIADLERESKYFREQAALAGDVPDVRDLWLALAEQLDRYVDAVRGARADMAAATLPLFAPRPP